MSCEIELFSSSLFLVLHPSPLQGNFSQIAIKYLDKLNNTPRATFTSDHYTFTYVVSEGFTFCVVADEDAGKSLPEAALGRIREEFIGRYSIKGQNVGEHALDKYVPRPTVLSIDLVKFVWCIYKVPKFRTYSLASFALFVFSSAGISAPGSRSACSMFRTTPRSSTKWQRFRRKWTR